MSTVQLGIILPQSTLSQQWFLVFAMVVGFNTLIYLGLTVSKLVPWPPQIHPNRVRALLPVTTSEESTVKKASRVSLRELNDPLVQLRHDAARRTIPQAMVLIGAVMLVVALLNLLAYDSPSMVHSIGGMITAFALIATSQVLARMKVNASTIIVAWTVFMVVIISEISFYAEDRSEPVILVNAVVLLIMLAPTSMSWRAGIIGSTVAGAAVLISGWFIDSLSPEPWILASLAAVTAGLVLLQLRMTILDRLAYAQMRANALASTDPLTGVFSRTGLLALAETIASAATASNQLVHVVLCDIHDLTSVNRSYGMDFGDESLQVTAKALKACLPKADLIARWDGDSFLALGVGPIGESSELTHLVGQAITRSGITLGKQDLSVTVQSVAGSPAHTSFEELVKQASIGVSEQQAAH